jgi:hypothetical protein
MSINEKMATKYRVVDLTAKMTEREEYVPQKENKQRRCSGTMEWK